MHTAIEIGLRVLFVAICVSAAVFVVSLILATKDDLNNWKDENDDAH